MKSYTASLLLAGLGLASARPTLDTRQTSNSVIVQIALGNGDAATTLRAGLGQTTQTSGINTRSGESSLFQDKTWCGGFKDAGATQLWTNFDGQGGIFSSGVNARYSELCEGGFCSEGAATVAVAAYWCADSLEAVQNRVRETIVPPNGLANGNNGGDNQNPPPVNNGGNNGGAAQQEVNVLVQLGDSDAATTRQAAVGAVTPAGVRTAANSIFESNVWCGSFRDEQATDLWTNFDGQGGIFTGGTPAIYHEACSDTGCGNGAVTVNVVSYWCADSLAGVENRIRQRTTPPNGRINGGNQGGNEQTPPPVNNGGAAPVDGEPVANIQVETERQTTFFGDEVPVNGQPQQIRQSAAISITLVSVDNLPQGASQADVECEVIGQNGEVIAALTALDAAVLTEGSEPVQFSAIQCQA